MLKPLDSSAERLQLSGAFPTLSQSPAGSPPPSCSRGCETERTCAAESVGAKRQKPHRKASIRLPPRAGRGPGPISAKVTSWARLRRVPESHLPAALDRGRVFGRARWSARQHRARWRRRLFAPLRLWPGRRVSAAPWVFPLALKREASIPVRWPGSLRHQHERRQRSAGSRCPAARGRARRLWPLASPPPGRKHRGLS